MLHVHTILAPVDFSEPSDRALAYAVELARQLDASLHVFHVQEMPVLATPSVGAPVPPELAAGAETDTRAELDRILAPYRDRGVTLRETLAHAGPPADAIVAYAREHPVDLIVMGTHGRTGLGRVLLGSVAEHVVRHAPCAVLTIPARATADR